jgi:F-type H+-transporting ATPase subunit a
MADALLHIKDAYYFDVPKALWPNHYQSLDEVPAFLRKAHPDASLEDFHHAMAGKILIPQALGGELKNLYEPASGLCISKFMVLEVVVAIFLYVVFNKLAERIKDGEVPRGKFWNALEAVLIYVRDEIAHPALHDDAHRFLPVLWTLFFFILGCNLLGIIPWLGAATGSFSVTLSLAAVTFLAGLVVGTFRLGLVGYWKNLVPHMHLPVWLQPLKLMIFAIELLGLLIKHGVLGVRLLANMVAGHLVLLAILGLIVEAAGGTFGSWAITTFISVLGSTLFSVLELGVAFLQAYVFTFLSALFISAAVHHH